jgi:hypothetical protein
MLTSTKSPGNCLTNSKMHLTPWRRSWLRKPFWLTQTSKYLSKYTDASAYQLGAAVSQNKKPIAFSLQKINPCTNRVHHYSTRITIHCWEPQRILDNPPRSTTHCSHQSRKLDLEALQLRSRHVMETLHWRIQSWSPLHQRHQNVTANALSCLGILNSPMNEEHFNKALILSCMCLRMMICPNWLFLSLMHLSLNRFFSKPSIEDLRLLTTFPLNCIKCPLPSQLEATIR